MKHKILILDASAVKKIFSMKDAVKVTEKAFKDFASGKARMPSKVYLDLPEFNGDFRAMPAYTSSPPLAGIKWVNSHPGNIKKNYPTVMATMIVCDAKTAVPLAFMDATYITSLRTGAAGALGAKYLARKNSKIVSLIGAGNQAIYQLSGLLSVFPEINSVRYFDPSKKSLDQFEKLIKSVYRKELIRSRNPEECVRDSDIIICTTPSRTPVIKNSWIKTGVHINAMGADAPGKQELESALLKRAKIIVDDVEQASHSGEINVPLKKGEFQLHEIHATLGEAILKKNIRTGDSDITVFDSTGLAIQDLYSAAWIIKKARINGAKETIFETG